MIATHVSWISTEPDVFVVRCSGFPNLAIAVAIYRKGSRPDAKIPEKWERKWKMATEMENGPKYEILAIFSPFFPFQRPFFAISGGGPFSIFFPIFRGIFAPDQFPIL